MMDLRTILKTWFPWLLLVIFAASWLYQRQNEANNRYVLDRGRELSRMNFLLDKKTGAVWVVAPENKYLIRRLKLAK